MRVDKREFVREFSELSFPGQTRTRNAREIMRVDKREFVGKFPSTRIRVDENELILQRVYPTILNAPKQYSLLYISYYSGDSEYSSAILNQE